MKLEIAFNKLHEEIKSEDLLFWGKIAGLERDYYIATGVNYTGHYQMAEKKFYWCLSAPTGNYKAFKFQELPEIFKDHLVDVQKYNSYFKGLPDDILDKYVQEITPEEQEELDKKKEEEQQQKDELQLLEEEEERANNPIIEKRNFLGRELNYLHVELGRLGFIVRQIDHDTSVFPEGAYKMIQLHEIRKNENFHGLCPKELLCLSKYQHFRNVISKEKIENIEKDEVIFQFNFYDSLDQDPVKSNKISYLFRMLVNTVRHYKDHSKLEKFTLARLLFIS